MTRVRLDETFFGTFPTPVFSVTKDPMPMLRGLRDAMRNKHLRPFRMMRGKVWGAKIRVLPPRDFLLDHVENVYSVLRGDFIFFWCGNHSPRSVWKPKGVCSAQLSPADRLA